MDKCPILNWIKCKCFAHLCNFSLDDKLYDVGNSKPLGYRKVATWFCVTGDERVSRDSILISQKSVPCVVWIVWRYKKTDDYRPIGIASVLRRR